MRLRTATWAALIPGWALFLLAVAWPTVALIGRSISEGAVPADGFGWSTRQLGLLWRSVWLSGVAAAMCLVLSLPVAYLIGQAGSLRRRPVLLALMTASLLCPPMVFSFGWERILPASFNPDLRCVAVWALWAWPIPAILIGTGWRREGARAYAAALLETTPMTAFLRIALPLMARHVAFGVLILFMLFFSDYGVPHACGLLVYATELLGWSSSSRFAIDTVWPAIPAIGITALVVVGLLLLGRSFARSADAGGAEAAPIGDRRTFPIALLVAFALSWVVPIGALLRFLRPPAVVLDALNIYGRDVAWSLGLAVLAAIASVLMGVSIAATPRARGIAITWTALFAALPGALVGEALIAAFQNPATSWLYDHWPIVALGYIARFGWIGLASAILVISRVGSDQIAQARTDGAGRLDLLRHIQIPMYGPTILGTIAVIVALSAAEVPVTSLIRVPSFSPLSLTIIEKFHRFEDGMMVALSLWLIAAGLVAGLIMSLILRRRSMT